MTESLAEGGETLRLAIGLVDAVNDGADMSRMVRRAIGDHRDVEAYREAVDLIAAANRDADASLHSALRLDQAELERVVRVFRRDDALSALYEADQRGTAPDVLGRSSQAGALAEAVWDERVDLDRVLSQAATGWRVERMAPVDRSILRIGTWELLRTPDTPIAVVISEAVRLAKVYSTEKSGSFVNGVLGRVASVARPVDEAAT